MSELAQRLYEIADELLLHDGDRDHMNTSYFANGSDLTCEQVAQLAKAMRYVALKMGHDPSC